MEKPTKKGSPKGQKKGLQPKGFVRQTLEYEGEEYEGIAVPKNHMRQGKMYDDFCVLNQEFLKYLLSVPLTKNDYRILMFLLSYMDKQNRIIIDSEMINYHLGVNATEVNKHISKLEKHKIIYKRSLGYKKGAELLINFDIITPHMAFKNKNNYDNVSSHKLLMRQDEPYIKQLNTSGNVDYINPDTGEVFHTKLTNQKSPSDE